MDKKNVKSLNVGLAVGLGMIFIGFILILCFAGTVPHLSVLILPDFLFLAGFANLFYFLAIKKSSFRLFLALTLTLCGVFASLIAYKVIPLSLKQMWPVFIMITGVCLFISARFRHASFSLSYDFSALMLILIGLLFLLFSLGVVTAPFRTIALFSGPLLLILGGIFLVILFLRRKALLEILPHEISDALNKDDDMEDCD
ncbi:MAG: hypothetical protein UHO11_00515 [Treponema sp.]|nr:hypothetical protein [Treponema sp.]